MLVLATQNYMSRLTGQKNGSSSGAAPFDFLEADTSRHSKGSSEHVDLGFNQSELAVLEDTTAVSE